MGFGDGFIDPSLNELYEELRKVDELLCQPKLLKPFEEVFDKSLGRPGTPAATGSSLGSLHARSTVARMWRGRLRASFSFIQSSPLFRKQQWTGPYLGWLKSFRWEDDCLKVCLDILLRLYEDLTLQVNELDQRIKKLAATER